MNMDGIIARISQFQKSGIMCSIATMGRNAIKISTLLCVEYLKGASIDCAQFAAQQAMRKLTRSGLG
jgi:hypothetical protein